MGNENEIELLKREIAQYADWKFNDLVIEKINEMIVKINMLFARPFVSTDNEENKTGENNNEGNLKNEDEQMGTQS